MCLSLHKRKNIDDAQFSPDPNVPNGSVWHSWGSLGLRRQKGIDSRLHVLAQIHVVKAVVVYVVVARTKGHEVVVR